MSIIIDRRLNGKNKSTVNRQRFHRQISEAYQKRLFPRLLTNGRSLMWSPAVRLLSPPKTLSEPFFRAWAGWSVTSRFIRVIKNLSPAIRIKRPSGGGQGRGSGQGKAGNSGEGMDEFSFQINHEEFLNHMFDDLELPNLVRKQLQDATEFKMKHAVVLPVKALPTDLNIVRSLKSAHARRIALGGGARREVRALRRKLREMEVSAETQLITLLKLRELRLSNQRAEQCQT